MHSHSIDSYELDYYQKLRKKIKIWFGSERGKSYRFAKWILVAPDLFHLLIRLAADPEVPLKEKGKLIAAIAYFMSPLDFLAELFLGPIGFIDDVVLTAYVLHSMINQTDHAILQKHWVGEENVLNVIRNILHHANRLVGSGLFKKLKRVVKR
jgi:uncharacterized membrane protein YkvA (DUF1232 family)